MTAVDAIARVAQLQSELQRLSGALGAPASGTSSGADAFAALLATTGAAATTSPDGAQAAHDADAPGTATGDAIVQAAEQYLGVPYVFGGESTSGMDCSGLVQKVLGDLGISAPRVVQDQAKLGTAVPSLAQAQPGDLIVEKGDGHIQIYAGNGEIIEAPKPGENVVKRKEWLSADQIGTIRRVASPNAGGGSAADAPAPAPAAPQLAQLAQSFGITAASAAAPTADRITQLAGAGAATAPAALPASTTPPAPTAAPQSAAAPALAPQLAGPIAQLVQSPGGGHTVVVRVVPEQLGPVTVNAQTTEHGMRIELSAPTDAGRDALAGVLTDLRRDLAQNGIAAGVGLAQADTAGTGAGAGGGGQAQQALVELLAQASAPVYSTSPGQAGPTSPARGATDALLDVLA
jgi:cell wall-associated NlpC family hydrolase